MCCTFLKPLNEDGNFKVLYACMKKEAQKSPEHTSEHVNSQKFLGAYPQTPITQSILWAHFLYLPWTPILLAAGPDGTFILCCCKGFAPRYVRTRLAYEPLQVLAVDKVSVIPGNPQVTLLLMFVLLVK